MTAEGAEEAEEVISISNFVNWYQVQESLALPIESGECLNQLSSVRDICAVVDFMATLQ
ncbi:hypothetical protein [Nostoc sp. JL31]|uniref:hypothetical protein n=1 Tax=Nostoc sp. JL31 TaxID=2815395 RepID=UPI0025CBB812|nr:hypothetical protein [Nostoc sp. JL31]